MKKSVKILLPLLAFVFLSIFLMSIVSAAISEDIAIGMTDFIDGVKSFGEPIFNALLGGSETGEAFNRKPAMHKQIMQMMAEGKVISTPLAGVKTFIFCRDGDYSKYGI